MSNQKNKRYPITEYAVAACALVLSYFLVNYYESNYFHENFSTYTKRFYVFLLMMILSGLIYILVSVFKFIIYKIKSKLAARKHDEKL
jgi:CDP-diglyceride synthetase